MNRDKPVLLIVDNPADNLFLLRQVIEESISGCTVLTTSNTEEAIKVAIESLPDGILCDIQMPGLNGIELCHQLKADEQTKQIPIILMADNSASHLHSEGLNAGANDFILKPIENIELAARINTMFRIKHTQDQLIVSNSELEQRLKERTAELQKANEDLIKERNAREKSEKEKEATEVRLRQAQKLEAIGTLSGGIAHDFNNILSAILGYTTLAKDVAPKDSTIASDLDIVLHSTKRAINLVNQILAFSRQAAKESFPLNIAPLIKETLKMLRSTLPATISIVQNIDSKIETVKVDPTQINQILLNLCTNAFHAMEKSGGTLNITLQQVSFNIDELEQEQDISAGSFVKLSVCDTGTGIAPDIQQKIFDPYFTTKEYGQGSGMGLSVIQGIVKTYGGFIRFESKLNEGSSFHVFFPVVETKALSTEEPEEKVMTGNEHILFVDDEQFLIDMGKKILTKLGYRVTTAENGFDAMAEFTKQPDSFDLVITDQTMSGMTGAELSKRLLQFKPDTRIILCTGYSAIMSEESAKSIGIKEFALKPLERKDLSKLVRKVLDAP